MTDPALRAAIAAVRAWTTLYTSGLPIEQRDARREEIDSDLWESVNDPASDRRSLALQIAARLIAGIPDDLGWRSEQAAPAAVRRWRVALTVAAVAIFALWLVGEQTTSEVGVLEDATDARQRLQVGAGRVLRCDQDEEQVAAKSNQWCLELDEMS